MSQLANLLDSEQEDVIMLNIKNITNIIRNQQKMSDKMYQDAIEANYSHEQMTPLNCILNTTGVLMDTLRTTSA